MEMPGIYSHQERQKVTLSFIVSFTRELISVGGFSMQSSILI